MATIDGKEQPVEITIFTDVNGNRYYNHILPMEENNKRSLSVYPAQASENGDGIPTVRQQAPSVDSNIPQNEPTSKGNSSKKNNIKSRVEKNMQRFRDGDLSSLEITRLLELEVKRIADLKSTYYCLAYNALDL